MDVEDIMKLFDFCWFEMEIFKRGANSLVSSSFEAYPDRQNKEKPSNPEIKPVFTTVRSIHRRSMSDQSSFISGSLSPDSVLFTPKLHTILSGKEIAEPEEGNQTQIQESPKQKVASRRRRNKGLSKSLSELEFEELKGFMDLGFVFSEEDKDSRLVEIIPALQRLGRTNGEEEKHVDESAISRPYLSEAWEEYDKRRRDAQNPLMNWKIPALNNDIDMKDNLRWWAHAVASTVR